jgi:hypothetical protein
MRLIAPLLFGYLATLPGTATAAWHVAETAHFRVYADGPEARLRLQAERLEKFDKALRLARGVPETAPGPAGRLTVYLLADRRQVAALAQNSGAAGAYFPRAGASVALVADLPADDKAPGAMDAQAVLFHEYAHHFLATTWPSAAMPLWVAEGWAEFNATATFRKDGAILVGKAPAYRAADLQAPSALPLASILAGTADPVRPEERAALYGRSWALVHYLTFAPARQGQLSAYLRAILERGQTPAEAAAVFGDAAVLERELQRFLGRLRIQGYVLKPTLLAIPPVTLRSLRAGEAAILPVQVRLFSGLGVAAARALQPEAQAIAARFPDDATVQRTLAAVANAAQDYAAGLAAADAALRADPMLVAAHCDRALALIGLAVDTQDRRAERWADIRATIARARQIDPDDPRPPELLYRSYLVTGETPPLEARNALVRAFELAPQDRSLRMQTARMLIAGGQASAARALLQGLVGDPHAAWMGAEAAALIRSLEAPPALR